MAEVKPEEASKGAFSDPKEAKETSNTKTKNRTRNSIIRISSGLADAVEASKAKTEAKMEVIPEVNKARGDTIEEGLEEAIDVAGSSILIILVDVKLENECPMTLLFCSGCKITNEIAKFAFCFDKARFILLLGEQIYAEHVRQASPSTAPSMLAVLVKYVNRKLKRFHINFDKHIAVLCCLRMVRASASERDCAIDDLLVPMSMSSVEVIV
uniref:Uncharacterized protein n=1 Tax=Romanomermis culicivorax TaxID=13658 RepID=A0A915JJF7_ROMCU